MIDILIKDDYFENPDLIRNIGLIYTTYRVDNEKKGPIIGWRGQRSFPISETNSNICPCCNQSINLHSFAHSLLVDESNKILKICENYFKLDEKFLEIKKDPFTITSYFHITTEETKQSFYDWNQQKFHADSHCAYAGIVYLNPQAPAQAGTSILDGQNNQFINIENKYNRLVLYESFRMHGISDVFGHSKETGRMTFTFFIHRLSDKNNFI